MKVRRATAADAPLFEEFTRKLYDEVTATTHDPLFTASADSFVANWVSWFQLHIARETGLVLIGENPEPAGFIASYVSPPPERPTCPLVTAFVAGMSSRKIPSFEPRARSAAFRS